MKKSACIETLFTELPFEDRFKAAKDAGFDYVEFWGWADKSLEAIRSASEKAAIPIGSMSGDMSFSLVDPTHKKDYIEFIGKSIRAGKKIRCDTLVIHSNALGEGGKVVNHYSDVSQTVKLCAMFDTLRDLAPIAEQAGITLVLEALNTSVDHVGNFLETTRMGAEMTRIIGSRNIKIGYIHAADTPGRHEPGTGEIHYPHVLAHLERIGYMGIVGYELFPKRSTADAVRAIMSL